MIIREAKTEDIQRMQVIRNSVTENTLSDPALVTDDDYQEFITLRGKGWVCEVDHQLVGFSIVDLHNHNIWALFLLPEFEKQGIGTQLHDVMLDWYFTQTENTVWLGTSPGTRAENFYRRAGWTETGMHGKDEVKFEMTHAEWAGRKIV